MPLRIVEILRVAPVAPDFKDMLHNTLVENMLGWIMSWTMQEKRGGFWP